MIPDQILYHLERMFKRDDIYGCGFDQDDIWNYHYHALEKLIEFKRINQSWFVPEAQPSATDTPRKQENE